MSNFFTKLCDYPMSLYHEFDPSRFIIITVAFSQGIQHLSDLSIQYMFKDDFKVSPAKMGLLMSYVAFPWIIKPVWGIFTDSKPFLGYRRKSYLVLFGMTGSMGWVLLAYYGINNMYYALAILFMIQFSVCFANVVGEAILVELAGKKNDQISAENQDQEFQNQASKNVSLFFGVRALGALISAYFSGALLIYITKKEVFLITSIFPLVLAIVALFLKEEKISGDNIDDRRVNTTQCLKDFWKFFKNPLIYKPVALIFCFMMAPTSSAIMFYFYTSVLNFTPQFLGQLKFLYAFGTIAGVLLYNSYLKGVSFKVIFCTTTIIYYFCYQSLIILVTRKNVEWGINDKIFCIGDSVMLQLVGELNLMPILVLACRMCPKNIEGTMYAMLMSTLNMGSMIGTQLGSLFLIVMGINENDYSKLWLFIMVTGVFVLFPLPFVYVVKEDEILKQREQLSQKDPSEIVVTQLIQEERKSSFRISDKETFAVESNEEQQRLLNE